MRSPTISSPCCRTRPRAWPVCSVATNRSSRHCGPDSLSSYLDSLTGILRGDLGPAVSGVPVSSDLAQQLLDTGPRLVVAASLVAAAAWIATALAPSRRRPTPWLDLLCLTPPYVHAFVALILLLLMGVTVDPTAGGPAWWVVIVSSAVAPAALVAAQASHVMSEALSSDHALFARSMGLREPELRRLLRREVWVSMAPSLERTFLWLFLSMLFGEIVLSLPGVGASFAVALRNTDVNMLLCQIGVIAVLSNTARVAATVVRARHGIVD